jgi:hypothetical protein
MDLAAVMQAVSDQLDTIVGLNCYAWPSSTVSPPAAVIAYPESIDPDLTYRRGKGRISLPVWVVVGNVSEKSTRDAIAAYVNSSGPASVVAVLDAGTYTAFDTLHVESIEFDVVTIGAVDYLGALFTLDISGSGN